MIGETISHYKVLEKLGGGGMGIVYKAEDTKLQRIVALKFLPLGLTRDDEARQRFMHEARAASALDHPNVCNIYEIDESNGQLFIAMAYYDGQTLKEKITEGPLTVGEATKIILQVAEGLSKAHEKDIVHRDIKPANIIITNDGVVKILDFGLAKLTGLSRLTRVGTTVGTVAYMSPEQTQGTEVDHRTDIWSLGVVFYEMVTGQLPFRGDYQQAIMYSIMNDEPEPLPELSKRVPIEFETVVRNCLEKVPSNRYETAEELLTDLRQLQANLKPGGLPFKKIVRKRMPRRLRRSFVLPALVVFSVLAAIAGYFFFGTDANNVERIHIAVADFINETDEQELDGLSGMLITSLEQSRRLSVLTRSRMFDILKQMGKEKVEHIDEVLGREICRKAKVNAMVLATVKKLGRIYTIDWKVLDTQKDEYIFTYLTQGEGQESILTMIDELSQKTREEFKEETEEIRAASPKIAQVTTPNLEAYKHYFKGEEYINKLRLEDAEKEFHKAIALDTTFALAYYRLAYADYWYGRQYGDEPLKKALAMIDRIPRKEKFMLRALQAILEKGYSRGPVILQEMVKHYPNDKEMLFNIGDWSYHAQQYTAAQNYLEKALALDPTSERTLQHLAWTYRDTGQYEKLQATAMKLTLVNEKVGYNVLGRYHDLLGEHQTALNYFQKAFQIDSTDLSTIQNLTETYQHARQYDEALKYGHKRFSIRGNFIAYNVIAETYRLMGDLSKALHWYQLGLQKFPDDELLLKKLGEVYAFNHESDKAESLLKGMIEANQPDNTRSSGYRGLSEFYPYVGKYSEMLNMFDKHTAFHWSNQDTNSVAEEIAWKAYWMYWGRRNKQEALAEISKVTQFNGIRNEKYYFWMAMLHADLGNLAKAKEFAAKVIHPWRKLRIEAEVHYAKGEWEKSIAKNQQLDKLDPELQPYHSYRSAQCYFEMGDLAEAITEIKKSQESYGDFFSFTYPQGFYLLGKIYEKMNDRKRAIENYEKFLDLWKDGDENLPDFVNAKAGLAKLKGTTASL